MPENDLARAMRLMQRQTGAPSGTNDLARAMQLRDERRRKSLGVTASDKARRAGFEPGESISTVRQRAYQTPEYQAAEQAFREAESRGASGADLEALSEARAGAFETAQRRLFAGNPDARRAAASEVEATRESYRKHANKKRWIDVMDEIERDPARLVPFLGAAKQADDLLRIHSLAKRVEDGQAGVDDLRELEQWVRDSQREPTFAAQVADILAELPAFAGEMLIASPLAAGGRAVAGRAGLTALRNRVRSALVKKTGRSLAGRAALRAGAGALAGASVASGEAVRFLPSATFGRAQAEAIRRSLPAMRMQENDAGALEVVLDGPVEDWRDNMAAGFVDTYVEFLTEQAGGMVRFLPGAGMARGIKGAIARRWMHKTGGTVNDLARRLSAGAKRAGRLAGWNGVIGEIFEERTGEAARGGLYALSDGEFGAPYQVPTLEQLATEAVAFTLVPLGAGAVTEAAGAVDRFAGRRGGPAAGGQAPGGVSGAPQAPAAPAGSTAPTGQAAPPPVPGIPQRRPLTPEEATGTPVPDFTLADGVPVFNDQARAERLAAFRNERLAEGEPGYRAVPLFRAAEGSPWIVVPDQQEASNVEVQQQGSEVVDGVQAAEELARDQAGGREGDEGAQAPQRLSAAESAEAERIGRESGIGLPTVRVMSRMVGRELNEDEVSAWERAFVRGRAGQTPPAPPEKVTVTGAERPVDAPKVEVSPAAEPAQAPAAEKSFDEQLDEAIDAGEMSQIQAQADAIKRGEPDAVAAFESLKAAAKRNPGGWQSDEVAAIERVIAGEAPKPAPPAVEQAREPWQMTKAEREAEIARLRAENAGILSTPLITEGAISPTQINRMGERERTRWQENAQRKLRLQETIRELSRSDDELRRDQERREKDEAKKTLSARLGMVETWRTVGRGKSGAIRPSIQKLIDEALAEVEAIYQRHPDLRPQATPEQPATPQVADATPDVAAPAPEAPALSTLSRDALLALAKSEGVAIPTPSHKAALVKAIEGKRAGTESTETAHPTIRAYVDELKRWMKGRAAIGKVDADAKREWLRDFGIPSSDTGRKLRYVYELSDGRKVSADGALKFTNPEAYERISKRHANLATAAARVEVFNALPDDVRTQIVDQLPIGEMALAGGDVYGAINKHLTSEGHILAEIWGRLPEVRNVLTNRIGHLQEAARSQFTDRVSAARAWRQINKSDAPIVTLERDGKFVSTRRDSDKHRDLIEYGGWVDVDANNAPDAATEPEDAPTLDEAEVARLFMVQVAKMAEANETITALNQQIDDLRKRARASKSNAMLAEIQKLEGRRSEAITAARLANQEIHDLRLANEVVRLPSGEIVPRTAIMEIKWREDAAPEAPTPEPESARGDAGRDAAPAAEPATGEPDAVPATEADTPGPDEATAPADQPAEPEDAKTIERRRAFLARLDVIINDPSNQNDPKVLIQKIDEEVEATAKMIGGRDLAVAAWNHPDFEGIRGEYERAHERLFKPVDLSQFDDLEGLTKLSLPSGTSHAAFIKKMKAAGKAIVTQMQAIRERGAINPLKADGSAGDTTAKPARTTPPSTSRLAPLAKTPADMLKRLMDAAARENSRYAVNGVDIKGQRASATDGRRLHVLLRKDGWGLADGTYFQSKDGWTSYATFDEPPQFPPIDDIFYRPADESRPYIPGDVAQEWPTIPLAQLASVIRRAALLTSDESPGVVLAVNPDGSYGAFSRAPDIGEAEINIRNDAINLATFNPDFLLDALNLFASLGHTHVRAWSGGPQRPLQIVAEDAVVIMMPVGNPDAQPFDRDALARATAASRASMPTEAAPKPKRGKGAKGNPAEPSRAAPLSDRIEAWAEGVIADIRSRRTPTRLPGSDLPGMRRGGTSLPSDIVDKALYLTAQLLRGAVKGYRAAKAALIAEFGAISNPEAESLFAEAVRMTRAIENAEAPTVKQAVLDRLAPKNISKQGKEPKAPKPGPLRETKIIAQAFREGRDRAITVLGGIAAEARKAAKADAKTREAKIEGLRDEVVRLVTDHLPPKMRGAFLTDVKNVRTLGDLSRSIGKMRRTLARWKAAELSARIRTQGKWDRLRRLSGVEASGVGTLSYRAHAKTLIDEAAGIADEFKRQVGKARGSGFTADVMEAKVERLEAILNTLLGYQAIFRNERKLIALGRGATLADLTEKIVEEVDDAKGQAARTREEERQDPATRARSRYGNLTRDILTLAGRFSKTLTDTLYHGMVRFEERYLSQRRDRYEAVSKAVKEAGFKDLDDAIDRTSRRGGTGRTIFRNVTIGGVKVRLTLGNILKIAAMLGDEDTAAQLRKGRKVVLEGGRKQVPLETTFDELQAIADTLTVDELAIVEQGRIIREGDRPALARVYRRIKGYEPKWVVGYEPRSVERAVKEAPGTFETMFAGGGTRWLENMGFLKERTGGGEALVIGDYLTDLMESLDNMAKVIHLASPIRDAYAVLTARPVSEAIVRKGGRDTYGLFKEYLVAASRANDLIRSLWGRFIQHVNRIAAVAKLGLNPRTWLRQLGTIPRMRASMSGAAFRAGLRGMWGVGWHDLYQSGYLYDRYHQHAEGRFSSQVETQSRGRRVFRDLERAFLNLVRRGEFRAAFRALQDAAAAPLEILQWWDSVTSRFAWAAAAHEAKKRGLDGEKATRYTIQRANQLVRENNNASSVLDMPMIGIAGKDTAAAIFTLFTSDSMKAKTRIERAATRGPKALAAHLGAEAVNIAWGLGVTVAIGAGIAAAVGMLGGEDDTERLIAESVQPKYLGLRAFRDAVSMVDPLMAPRVLEWASGYSEQGRTMLDAPAISMFQDVEKAVARGIRAFESEDEGRMIEAADILARDVTAIVGLNPLQSLWREVSRTIKALDD